MNCMMSVDRFESGDEIRSLLKGMRRRLDPAAPKLGDHERVSSRRGRAVSQEELAEAVGVSRNWYASIERGEPVSPSIAMLRRLATALNATPDERAELFQLAIPDLRGLL